jgi:hypothetical protein
MLIRVDPRYRGVLAGRLEAGSFELFFEVFEGQSQRGRAAVGAVAGSLGGGAAGE